MATLRASVCVLGCAGPEPIDAEGNVYASTHIEIDAANGIRGLSSARLELTDSAGSVVARGTPSAGLTVVSAENRPLGPFSGDVAAGAHVRLWVSMRLDARGPELAKTPPTHFRLSLTRSGGETLRAAGAVQAAGETAAPAGAR